MEADLLRYFNVDLRDLGRGLTYRRLGVLVESLPRDSRVSVELSRDAPEREPTDEELERMWKLEHHLLAGIHDALNVANWQRGKKGSKRPKPLPRPGVRGSKRVRAGGSELTPEQKIEALKKRAPKRKD